MVKGRAESVCNRIVWRTRHMDVYVLNCASFTPVPPPPQKSVFLFGLRALYSTYPPGTITSLSDLENITESARRDLTSLSPLKRRPTTAPFSGGPPSAPPPSRRRWSAESRRPRPDSFYRFPFVDDNGTIGQILSGVCKLVRMTRLPVGVR